MMLLLERLFPAHFLQEMTAEFDLEKWQVSFPSAFEEAICLALPKGWPKTMPAKRRAPDADLSEVMRYTNRRAELLYHKLSDTCAGEPLAVGRIGGYRLARKYRARA